MNKRVTKRKKMNNDQNKFQPNTHETRCRRDGKKPVGSSSPTSHNPRYTRHTTLNTKEEEYSNLRHAPSSYWEKKRTKQEIDTLLPRVCAV